MADDPVQSVADPQVSDPNIIPPPESASSDSNRPVSTILADSPIEPKTPLADPGSDYTPPSIPADPPVATESASIASSPSTIPADLPTSTLISPQSPLSPISPPEEPSIPSIPPDPSVSSVSSSPPEATSGGSIQDSLPSDQPSQVQPEAPESASSPQAFQTTEKASQSAEIKPEPLEGTQNAPLADSNSPKSSFGDLMGTTEPSFPVPSDEPTRSPVSLPPTISPEPASSAPETSFGDLTEKTLAEEPTINIEPIEAPKPVQPPLPPVASAKEGSSPQTVIEAKADFSVKRQQALQTRRKKREDHLAKILALVSQKGKIHNSDIVTFLRVSQSTATNYLHSLVKDGKIKKEGKAKATVYFL